MKKLIATVIAALMGLSAVAALAIVGRETGPEGKKLYFDGVSLSTQYALADYALMGASSLADPLKAYAANEVIFGCLKYVFDDNNPDAAENIFVSIKSEYATFPLYLNTGAQYSRGGILPLFMEGGNAKAHYADKNGVLQPFKLGGNGAVVPNPFSVVCAKDGEEFSVNFIADSIFVEGAELRPKGAFYDRVDGGMETAKSNLVDALIAEGIAVADADVTETVNTYSYFTGSGVTPVLPKSGERRATEIYVGFNGVVRASAAKEGSVEAYVTVAGDAFRNSYSPSSGSHGFQYVGDYASGHMGAPTGFGRNEASGYAPFIDVYDGGKHLCRVYALGEYFDAPALTAVEYLVQMADAADSDRLLDWAVGFQNLDGKRFGKITYREGLPTTKDDWASGKDWFSSTDAGAVAFSAAGGFPDLAVKSDGTANYADMCWYNAASLNGNRFFKVKDIAGGKIAEDIRDGNALDGRITPIMEWFGFSFDYGNATRDTDYEARAGWKDTREVPFRYAGA